MTPSRARLAALLLLPLLAACGGSDEGSSRPAGRIVFTVNVGGFGEIWVMDADGGNRTRLTEPAPGDPSDASGATNPAWSPDGRRIAFVSSGAAEREDPRDLDLYVMRADGSELRRLTEDRVFDAFPAWSPDGRRIAFMHAPRWGREDGTATIVVVDVTTGERIPVTRHPSGPTPVFDGQPAWSPDGRLIAFARTTYAEGPAQQAVYAIAPDGTGEWLLVEDAGNPAWSPDGSRLAFTSTRDEHGRTCFHECSPSGEIYVARADGSGLRRLTRSEADDHSPAWSPDGRWIVFVSDRSGPERHEYELYRIAADGSGLRRLTTNDVWDLEPAWGPTR